VNLSKINLFSKNQSKRFHSTVYSILDFEEYPGERLEVRLENKAKCDKLDLKKYLSFSKRLDLATLASFTLPSLKTLKGHV
jgi:hypothetical protein